MRYAYRRVTDAPLNEVIRSVAGSAARHGMAVIRSLDMQDSLAAKGFDIRPLKIVEIGPSGISSDARLAMLLPCRLNIYEEGGHVVVAALRPSLFLEVYPEQGLEQAAARLEAAIIAIVDEVCGVLS